MYKNSRIYCSITALVADRVTHITPILFLVIQRIADMNPDARYVEWRISSAKKSKPKSKLQTKGLSEVETVVAADKDEWIRLSPPESSFVSAFKAFHYGH